MTTIKIDEITQIIQGIKQEIARGIIGQNDFIDGLLYAILANGHVLVESVPGLAKTRAIQLMSRIAGLSFKRLQFTPDLLPADIIGTRIYNQSTSSFETKKGPVFASFILADEINRAPAKVQSALLECMQEHQVTIGEETFQLPDPFFVFATQNPIEQEGTYPLPEAQLDRFLMKLLLDYPTEKDEADIVEMVIQETVLPEMRSLLSDQTILSLQAAVRKVHIEPRLIQYITQIVNATRNPEGILKEKGHYIAWGASPRASIGLAQTARAHALCDGRDHVIPDDIKNMANAILRHRIILTYYAGAENVTSEDIIETILSEIKVP